MRLVADDVVTLTVEDTGRGVAPERLGALRERFRRGDEQKPGAGLGLPIVEEIATLFDGRLELASAPGRGFRATLFLRSALEPQFLDNGRSVSETEIRRPIASLRWLGCPESVHLRNVLVSSARAPCSGRMKPLASALPAIPRRSAGPRKRLRYSIV